MVDALYIMRAKDYYFWVKTRLTEQAVVTFCSAAIVRTIQCGMHEIEMHVTVLVTAEHASTLATAAVRRTERSQVF